MRARIERDALKRALRTVMPAVGKTALPVLGGVRIDTIEGDGLRLTASDLQLTITAEVDAKVLDPGAVVVPARLFSNFIDRCPDGGVVLEVADNLTVTAGDATADLHLLSVGAWPQVGPVQGESLTLTEHQVDLLRRVAPFACTDKAPEKAKWTGIRIGGDRATATDSFRLASATLAGADLPPALVPMGALLAALKDASEVEVTVADRKVTFAHDAATWTTTLIEGEWPDVMRVVPASTPNSLTFHSARLADSLGRVGVLNGDGRAVKITTAGDSATVWIEQPDVGRVEDVIPCAGDWEGTIGFSPDFLGSVIEAAQVDDLVLGVTDHLKPVVHRTDELVLLLMPVRAPGTGS